MYNWLTATKFVEVEYKIIKICGKEDSEKAAFDNLKEDLKRKYPNIETCELMSQW